MTRQTEHFVLAAILLLAWAALTHAQSSFQSSNVLITDLSGTAGRSYTADLQYWATSGQEAILYTIPISSTSSIVILEDFASGIRYVSCDQSCSVESLSGVSFPQLSSTTPSTTSWSYGSFDRTFTFNNALTALSARPTIPAICSGVSTATLTSDQCLPFGLPCGASCVCLGCTDGDDCTVNDMCALDSNKALTCTGTEACNRTSVPWTAIALRRHHGGGSGTAVALGVALGVGIGVPVGIFLLFLLCALPLILLPLLWRRRERRPTVVQTTAVPVGYAGAPAPVAVGNPLYAEPWRTAALPQGLAGQQATAVPGAGGAAGVPIYSGASAAPGL